MTYGRQTAPNTLMPRFLFLAFVLLSAPAASAQLSGFYSIGAPGGAYPGGDFFTFNEAVTALETQGVDGPVTMSLVTGTGGGIYDQSRVIMDDIPGASATNTVLFTSSGATITNTSGAFGEVLVVLADHVTFRGIVFDVSFSGNSGVRVSGDDVTFEDCTFRAPGNNGTNDSRHLWVFGDRVTVTDNTFEGGGPGLRAISAQSSLSQGTVDDLTITGNTFTGSAGTAIEVDRSSGGPSNVATDLTIEDNDINASNGIAVAPATRVSIQRNTVRANRQALAVTDGVEVTVANNLLSGGGTDTVADVSVTAGFFMHNTVVRTGAAAPALDFFADQGASTRVENNLLIALGGGLPAAFESGVTPVRVRQNVYSTSASDFVTYGGTGYSTIQDFKLGTGGQGVRSLRRTVTFVNLAARNYRLADASLGDPFLLMPRIDDFEIDVATDVDGDPRAANYVTAGAEEGATAPLAGFVTVDDDGPADFPSLVWVVQALTLRGMSDAVQVNVEPGTYVGQLTFGAIPGLSFFDRLTIVGNASARPVIEYAAQSSADNWVIRIDGTDYLTLSGLYIRPTSTDFANGIILENGSNNTIESCTLGAPQATASGRLVSTVGANPVIPSTKIIGNEFLTLESTLMSAISLLTHSSGVLIRDNVVRGSGRGNKFSVGMSVLFSPGMIIEGNIIEDTRVGLNMRGTASAVVRRNRVVAEQSSFYVLSAVSTSNSPVLIENNVFTSEDLTASATPSIQINDSDHVRFVHNSVYSQSDVAALQVDWAESGESANVEITRNIVHMEGEGVALKVRSAAAISISDHNRFSLGASAGPAFATIGSTDFSDLEAYRDRPRLGEEPRFGLETAVLRAPDAITFLNPDSGNLSLGAGSNGDQELLVASDPSVTADLLERPRGAISTYAGALLGVALDPLAPGNYTVGGATPDFATPQEAARAVSTRGIASDGTVFFRIQPGVYDGPAIVLDPIPAASESRRVTFIGPVIVSGAAPQVTLGTTLGESVMQLDGVSHVTLAYLGMIGNLNAIVQGTGSDLVFSRVLFEKGTFGLDLGVGFDTRVTNGSRFIDQTAGGIRLERQYGFLIDKALVETDRAEEKGFAGIKLIGTYGGQVFQSRIDVAGGEATGLLVRDLFAVPSDGVQIVNNSIVATSRGVDFDDVRAIVTFAHNSVLARDGAAISANYSALEDENEGYEAIIRNNVFVSESGYALAGESVAFATSTSNVFSTPSSTFAIIDDVQYGSLAELRAATGLEPGSSEAPVQFSDAAAGDLHLGGTSVRDARLGVPRIEPITIGGTVVAPGVLTDFDGNVRPEITYAGMDEVAGSPLPQSAPFALTVVLQGAYDAGSGAMRTSLRDEGFLPLAQPYSAAAFDGTLLNYGGTEATTAQVLTDNPVVDWVLVELRETATGPASVRLAALLLADGSVVGADGQPLGITGAPASAFVVVRHRNHGAAMTATAVSLSASVDLSAGSGYGAGGMTEVGAGVWALWAADGSLDGQVTAPDFNVYGASSPAGYVVGDYTLDGQVTAPDFNVYSQNAASSASSAVPEE